MKLARAVAVFAAVVILISGCVMAHAGSPDNYTLMWKEMVQGNPRVKMTRGLTKQSCEDAAARLAQLSAFCAATPFEMPPLKSGDDAQANSKGN
jgi:hypothetical protein